MNWRIARNLARLAAFLLAFGLIPAALAKEAPGQGENSPLAIDNGAEPIPLSEAFAKKGFRLGSPVLLRVYKQSSEIELWVLKGPRFALFKTYPICRWSGELGPKLMEGDRQSPEGIYHISASGLIVNRRWHRAMRLNYPNAFDMVNGHTGSGILIHGNCTSTGCFAIADGVEEVYEAVEAALRSGQARVPVLSLPFRFTAVPPGDDDPPGLGPFWRELRQADLLFGRDRLPPPALLCDGHYYFADRRGGAKRHVVSLRGCQPLDKPVDMAAIRRAAPTLLAAWKELSPKDAAEKAARTCDPRQLRCRMLRVAIASSVACPKKYSRCRAAYAAYTKSVDCPLKYPRCRWFVGPDPGPAAGVHASVSLKGRRAKR